MGSDTIIKCYITVVKYHTPCLSSLYIIRVFDCPKMNPPFANKILMLGEGYPSCLRPHKVNSRTTELIMESSVPPSFEFTHIYLLVKLVF